MNFQSNRSYGYIIKIKFRKLQGMNEGIQSSLLLWLSKAIKIENPKVQDLKDPKYFHTLASGIPRMPMIQHVEHNERGQPWQTNYINFKNIYQALQNYYKTVLISSLPMGLPSVNLLEISKGQDNEGLITLLTIFFIACINSDTKEKYITNIMQLGQSEQRELMNLIQEKNLNSLEVGQELTATETQEIERSKIDEYLFKIQSLAAQNQSLTNQLLADNEQKQKLRDQIKKLQGQNKRIKRELDEKILYLHQKQQQEQQQQSSKRVMSDSNELVITQLRKQLIDQQKEHLEEKKAIDEKIEVLTQQLSVAHDKIAQFQSDDLIGQVGNRKIHHQDCVSVNEHKNVTQKLQLKLKNLQQAQTELSRELLKSQYLNKELQRKYKKQQTQKQSIKTEYERISANQGKMISQKDADRIKLSILHAIKENLTKKKEEMIKGSRSA